MGEDPQEYIKNCKRKAANSIECQVETVGLNALQFKFIMGINLAVSRLHKEMSFPLQE